MTCTDVRALLTNHLKGMPLPQEALNHLASCPACRQEFAQMVELWTGLRRLPDPEPSQALRARVLGVRPKAHRLMPRQALFAAAGVLILLGGVGLGLSMRRTPNVDPETWAETARSRGMLRLVHSPSATDRMKGLALVGAGDEDFAGTLMTLVAEDPDTQVRLAAVESLYLFAEDPRIRAELGDALAHQDRPEVRMALLDLIVGIRERRAVEAIRQLIRNGKVSPEQRRRMADGLTRLGAAPM